MDHTSSGKIITFYSYKGGVSRTMLLANVAWILASNGKRVLAIDWDLEAPGLHRYFRPFLADQELTETEGLIDFLTEFVDEAVTPSENTEEPDAAWYEPLTNLLRYAESLEWDFPGEGTIDFVPAGRQGATYSTRVNLFNWQDFYERFGGGAFLEKVKQKIRAEYDYILIDSRTGVSDTSGICTIQMPDILVVLFTANNQSLFGAARIAASVTTQWQQSNPSKNERRLFPILTRTDDSEKEKLDKARTLARDTFDPFLRHLSNEEREEYWGKVEIPYIPWYSYEEVLTPFGDDPRQRRSLLASIEFFVNYLTNGEVRELVPPDAKERQRVLKSIRAYTQSRQASLANIQLQAQAQVPVENMPACKIITFYSYKGGVGRTMLLANVAWILANNGKRVLMIDWDLEAPGLHYYFHPFLQDQELSSTPGMIDFLMIFAHGKETAPKILSYAKPIIYEFPKKGKIDFIPAGQQKASYAKNVNAFNWQEFYEHSEFEAFIENFKEQIRADYDYILIDSRTGVSDTFDICTIRMPDILVALFTANTQSMLGAAEITAAVTKQWQTTHSKHQKLLFPILTRADETEKINLQNARDRARTIFTSFPQHLSSREQEQYWGNVELPYIPWYSYEEALSPFWDDLKQQRSLLASIESFVSYLNGIKSRNFHTSKHSLPHWPIQSYCEGGAVYYHWRYIRGQSYDGGTCWPRCVVADEANSGILQSHA